MRSRLLIAGILLAVTTIFSSCIVTPGYYGYHGHWGGYYHSGCHHGYYHGGGYYR